MLLIFHVTFMEGTALAVFDVSCPVVNTTVGTFLLRSSLDGSQSSFDNSTIYAYHTSIVNFATGVMRSAVRILHLTQAQF